ncbi:MAG: hypothetical protein GY936_03860 [Ignavibacteriae bacterium]|nr:hypothetical protein [Ignavibacteriota bacterium]
MTFNPSYNITVKESKENFEENIAFNRVPNERRSVFEQYVIDLVSTFPNVKYRFCESSQKNFHHFLIETESFILTFKQGNLKKLPQNEIQYTLFGNIEVNSSVQKHIRIEHGAKDVFAVMPDFINFVYPGITSFSYLELLQNLTDDEPIENISIETNIVLKDINSDRIAK